MPIQLRKTLARTQDMTLRPYRKITATQVWRLWAALERQGAQLADLQASQRRLEHQLLVQHRILVAADADRRKITAYMEQTAPTTPGSGSGTWQWHSYSLAPTTPGIGRGAWYWQSEMSDSSGSDS